ncbi:MAG: sugar ABC transporter permease [Thermoplasmata archaeon]
MSITFLGLATLFSFLLGFILSLLIYKVGGKIYDLIMVIFLLPALSSRVAISLIWRWMYQPTIGIINYFMRLIKLQGLSWLYDPNTALMSILVVDIWQWAQFLSLLIITAIRSLPSNILEAAEVDGASEIQKIRYIMVPLLIPHFIGIIFIKALLSLRTFDLIWNMTRGGRVYPLK